MLTFYSTSIQPYALMCDVSNSEAAKKNPRWWISPSRSRFWRISNHALRWWDVPPSEAVKKTPVNGISPARRWSNIDPSIHPDDEISPTWRQKYDSFATGMCCPLRGSCLYIPRWGMPLLGSVNADMPTGLSR